MISAVCYLIVILVENYITFYYFDSKYERALDRKFIFIPIIIASVIMFAVNFIEIPNINAVSFFICTFSVSKICFKTGMKSSLFSTFILLVLMIVTELIVVFFFSAVFTLEIYASYDDFFVLIVQAIICKLLYFLSVYLIIKFVEKENNQSRSKASLMLCVLPVASLTTMPLTLYFCSEYPVSSEIKYAVLVSNILILISNILVFYIHENTIKTNRKYTELLLLNQQEKENLEYYKLLKEQNEALRVLRHDITRHLNTIRQLTKDGSSEVSSYISEVVEDFNLLNPVDYCNNPTVNLITHRYNDICRKKGIALSIDIKCADMGFMKEPDITALLDNLLENAVESAEKTDGGFIDFSISRRNANFAVIMVSNACEKRPSYKGGALVSSKSGSSIHGFGTRSIKRVVSKYDGSLNMGFDSENKIFKTIIVIRINRCDSKVHSESKIR